MLERRRTDAGAVFHRVARGFGTSRTRVEILLFVFLAPAPLPVGDVAEAIGVTPQVASGHLRKLEYAGLLVRDRQKTPTGTIVYYQPSRLAVAIIRAIDETDEGGA